MELCEVISSDDRRQRRLGMPSLRQSGQTTQRRLGMPSLRKSKTNTHHEF